MYQNTGVLTPKTIEDLDDLKYQEDENIENPYQRQFGAKKKTIFSVQNSKVFDSENDSDEENNSQVRDKQVVISLCDFDEIETKNDKEKSVIFNKKKKESEFDEYPKKLRN